MKTAHLIATALSLFTTTAALTTLGSQAHAASWMDFDVRATPIGGLSDNSQNPTILNQVTVVCPETGFLVAESSSTAFLRNLVGTKSTGFVVYSISRQLKRDEVYDAIVVKNLGPNTFANIPASVHRIDVCTAGETVTYFHTAHGSAGPGNQVANEGHSRLVVQFFNRRI